MRPGAPTRLLAPLRYLKRTYDESDEFVVERRVENPCRRHSCGYEYFQHELPWRPTSLVKWRQQIKAE
jgi:IS5 family transposase